MAAAALDITKLVASATSNAGSIEQSNQQLAQASGGLARESGPLDVWRFTAAEMGRRSDVGASGQEQDPGRALAAGVQGRWARASTGAVADSGAAQVSGLKDQFLAIVGEGDPKAVPQGALATVGAAFGALTSIEQLLSAPLSLIPFPAFPALRITDMDIGLPHAHAHPPNLIPPAPPVPLPSTGPVIPIPLLSGANKTLINGMPAARCGDMGLGIWCGGYFPMYEVFLGSSSVWIEGCRAGRIGVDITKHCVFSSPKPSDPPMGPMIGTTVMASPNVIIGGVPVPSLVNMALGAMFKAMFKGLGKVAGKVRAARAAKAAREAGEAAGRGVQKFSRAGASKFWRSIVMSWRSMKRSLTRRNPGRGDISLADYQAASRMVDDLLASGAVHIDDGVSAATRAAIERDLRKIASTKAGRELMAELELNKIRHGSSVRIRDLPADHPLAGFGPHMEPAHHQAGPWTPNDDPATSKDLPFLTESKGVPSDGTVRYNPEEYLPNSPESPSDVVLFHELEHAKNSGRGDSLHNIKPGDEAESARWSNLEEQNTIARENAYREERGLPARDGHDDLP